jgi:hypothetical protein
MTLQLLHSEFPYILGKFCFLFYQCAIVQNTEVKGIFPSLGEGDRREFMFSTLVEAKYGLLYVVFQQRCLTASHHKLLAYSMM